MPEQLGEVIFERDFLSQDEFGVEQAVKLQVGRPQVDVQRSQNSENPLWSCAHLITGIGDERILPAWGADALDAMLLSLALADSMLEFYARREYKTLTWRGQGNLHLPKLPPSDTGVETTFKFSGFEEIFEQFFRDFIRKNRPSGTGDHLTPRP